MKLIYAQGFSKNERLEWKPVVFNNIIQSFRLIFDAMQELELDFGSKENEASLPRRPHVGIASKELDRANVVLPCRKTWPL